MKIISSICLNPLLFRRSNMVLFENNIKNINVPACSECKFYKPESRFNFDSRFSKCTKYGKKDIYTGEITYEDIYSCRNDRNKCGIEGRDFEGEPNILEKKFIHHIKNCWFWYLYVSFLIALIKIQYSI